MKLQLKALAAATVASVMISGASAHTTASAGTGANVATSADLKIKIIVPKIVILRVGSTGTSAGTIDEIEFTAVPGNISGTSQTYTGAIPPTSANVSVTSTTSSTVPVAVWTNNGTVTVGCSATAIAGTGAPALTDITVNAATTVPHPGTSLGACGTGAALTVPLASALTDNWVFGLNGSVYAAGTYSTTATYTATTP